MFRGIENLQIRLRFEGKHEEADLIDQIAERQIKHVESLTEVPNIVRFMNLSFVAFLVWDDKQVAGKKVGTWYCIICYSDQEEEVIKAFKP